MGRGAAQLGKAVKGKSKDKRRDRLAAQNDAAAGAHAGQAQLHSDMRHLADYERLALAQQQQKTRLRHLATEEQQLSRTNQSILTTLHRTALRDDKLHSLQSEIVILSENHSRDFARKELLLQQLLAQVEASDAQTVYAQKAHMSHLAVLGQLHERELSQIDEEFQAQITQLQTDFALEARTQQDSHLESQVELQHLISLLESDAANAQALRRAQHEAALEEIRNKNLEQINELRINLENRIEELERQFDELHRAHTDNTETQNAHFQRLKALDAATQQQMNDKRKRISQLQDAIKNWRNKYAVSLRDNAVRNSLLERQKNLVQHHTQQLKAHMASFRALEARRLVQLTGSARAAQQTCQEQLRQFERILSAAEVSRKQETESERIRAFTLQTEVQQSNAASNQRRKLPSEASAGGAAASQSDSASPQQARSVGDSFASDEKTNFTRDESDALQDSDDVLVPSSLSASPVWTSLDTFYEKYNKVLLDKLAIQAEKSRLAQENRQLKQLLQQYLDGIAITDQSVLADNNPLLIVNGRLSLAETQLAATQQLNAPGAQQVRRQQGRPKITQDANTITHQYNTQMGARG